MIFLSTSTAHLLLLLTLQSLIHVFRGNFYILCIRVFYDFTSHFDTGSPSQDRRRSAALGSRRVDSGDASIVPTRIQIEVWKFVAVSVIF